MKRKVSNEQLAAAVLSSRTKSEAAQKCGVTRRVIYQRMSTDREFRQLLKQGAMDTLQGCINSMRAGLCESVDYARGVIGDSTQQTCYRLQAAQMIMSSFPKLNTEFESQERDAMPASMAGKAVLMWLKDMEKRSYAQIESIQQVQSARSESWQQFDDSFKIHPNGDGTYNFGSRAGGRKNE